MYKVGDKVVCMNKKYNKPLKLYNTYTVNEILIGNDNFISFEETDTLGSTKYYHKDHFISELEFRKLKIEKICQRAKKVII